MAVTIYLIDVKWATYFPPLLTCHQIQCWHEWTKFMAIIIKTEEDIQKMRVAGRLAAEVLEMIAPHVVPGVSTGELDRLCHQHIVDVQQAIPACLNYHGFPKSVCISVNDVICHGIPSDDKILKDGDIVNIDVTVIKDGFMAIPPKCLLLVNQPFKVSAFAKSH